MTKKKKLFIFGGAAVVLAAIVFLSLRARSQDVVEVQTGEVTRVEKLVAKVNASGEIKPKEFVELQAEISGVINELYVKEGDFVEKGQLLLKIDPTQTEAETRAQRALLEAAVIDVANQKAQIAVQEANVQREEANVRAAKSDVARSRQALELAQNNFRRQQELFEDNLIPRDVYEASKNDLVGAESALAAASARLDQAEAQLHVSRVVLEQAHNSLESADTRVRQNRALLERSEDSLAKTSIRAPLTGVITQLNVEKGERAVPGTLNNPAATLLIIADLSVIEAEIEVDETDIVNVKLGQPAVVKVDALPDLPLKGVVTEIGNSAIPKTGGDQEAKDFKVAIRLEEPPQSLRPGLSCTADITTDTQDDILTIPIQALTVREFELDEAGNPIKKTRQELDKEAASGTVKAKTKVQRKDFTGVFKIVDRKAEFMPVTTGITGDTDIEIKSGLSEGDVIVTGSYKALRTLNEGDPVKVEQKRERG